MKIIVLRHGTRKRGEDPAVEEYNEKNLPLDAGGQAATKRLGTQLAARGLKPSVYFTSCFAHARETGEILRGTVGGEPPAKVLSLCALTPHYQGPKEWRCREEWKGVRILETIGHEARATGNELRALDLVAFIMHQPRLLQLLAGMTSESESRYLKIGYSEGVCVEAESFDALVRGEGKEISPRLTPNAHVPE